MRKLTGREKVLIIITVIMVSAWFLNYYLQQTGKTIEYAQVSRGNIESIVKVSGLIDSEFSEKIISNAEGIVSELTLKEGDRVKAGQKICSLRNPSLREKLLQLDGELKLAKGELETNKNDKILARYNFLRANIADFRAAMEPSSHINGDLLSVNVKNGEKVLPGSPLFTIADMQRPIIKARLSESDLPYVRLGNPAMITADFLGNEILPGLVVKIGSSVSHDVSSYIETWISVLNPQNIQIKFGAYAEAKIVTGRKKNVLRVPREAVLFDGGNYVFTIERGRARKKKVKLGIMGEDYVEVLSGIKERDRVVVRGELDLEEGERVRVEKKI